MPRKTFVTVNIFVDGKKVVAQVNAETEVKFHFGASGNLLEGAMTGIRDLEALH
jgi:hypothetical protein